MLNVVLLVALASHGFAGENQGLADPAVTAAFGPQDTIQAPPVVDTGTAFAASATGSARWNRWVAGLSNNRSGGGCNTNGGGAGGGRRRLRRR